MKIIHLTGYYSEKMLYQENLLPSGQVEIGHSVKIFTSDQLPTYFPPETLRRELTDRMVQITRKKNYFAHTQCIANFLGKKRRD